MIDILLIIGGLVLLFFGGEALIKGAVALARNFGLSKLLVSAVVVGFGTSMPEMTVSVGAALRGAPDIAIGNVVGSNIANILLIVGVAVILSPIIMRAASVRRDTIVMLAASIALCGLAIIGEASLISGLLMFLALITYIAWSYHQDRQSGTVTAEHIGEDIEGEVHLNSMKAGLYAFVGLGFLIGGASMLVEGAIAIARGFGISESVIGLTIVAVGTSLPELATAIVAAYKKHSDIIIGNILGSNIFNIFAILGITSMIAPIPIQGQIAAIDVWLMFGVAIFLSLYLLRGIKIGFLSGMTMIAAYIFYMVWLYLGGSGS